MSHLEIIRIERGYTQIWRINTGFYSNKLNPNKIYIIKESVNIS